MINPLAPAPTCATAWLAAANYLERVGGDAYNLIVDIDNPAQHSEQDAATIQEVDRFLRAHGANPIVTVANTIFPNDLARRHKGSALREEYLATYGKLKKSWGRYFERMVRWPPDGSDQLHNIIDRLRTQISNRRPFHNIYELSLFNPPTDAHLNMNRQCLSFLSFKLHPDRGLMLTAIYRNHYYITRALGNFIGLGNLMKYVADQAGISVGPLTCISTHAQIDNSPKKKHRSKSTEATVPWTISDARAMLMAASTAADVCNNTNTTQAAPDDVAK